MTASSPLPSGAAAPVALSDETRARLMRCSSASVSTQLVRRGLRNIAIAGVLPIRQGLPPMVGPAFTLRYIPAREDVDVYGRSNDPSTPQRRAIETVPAGHVLVMDCRREPEIAGIGSILTRRLQERGVAGVVLDGGVRDTRTVSGFEMPVYCLGPAAPPNFVGHHAVDCNQPIACGGVAVFPGDIIFGDHEAVIVIPAHLADEVAADAVAMEQREVFLLKEIEAGRSIVGVYPPNADTMARYEVWARENGIGAAVKDDEP
jgi:regulator of RNase E activity RraA